MNGGFKTIFSTNREVLKSNESHPSRQDSSEMREDTRKSYLLSVRTRAIENGLVKIRNIRLFSAAAGKIVLVNIFTPENVRKVTCVSMFIFSCSFTRFQRLLSLSWLSWKVAPVLWHAEYNFWSFFHTSIYILIYLRKLDGLFYRKQRSMITLWS
jgi:hypothetical protein